MTRKLKRRAFAVATFTIFAFMAEVTAALAGFGPLGRWVLRGGLWLLGAVAAFLVTRLFAAGETEATPEQEPSAEVDEAFDQIRRRLSESRIGESRIGRLPVVLLLGPRGGTKTTLIERNGVETELLVGDVRREDRVVPTDLLNIWFGGGTLFVEAGGGLFREPGRWSRTVEHLRPERLRAALGRGRQAPRVAVVCFPCDQFLESGRAEAVPAAAKQIRERLHELSRRLGIRLPVYVIFTRADRLPHFEEYLRPFTSEEARQVLGATLRMDRNGASGAWSERESTRLSSSFDDLFRSLARRRVELLDRESDPEARGAIYEFPREFRKVRDLAVRFMVELCRPSQLAASPFLRGYYFTGVRPVIVEGDAAPQPADPRGEETPVGATMVFDRAAARGSAPPASSSGERRAPEWAFLGRLFPDVILEDRAAMAATGGGTQVNLLRRTLVGAAAALGLLLVLGLTASFSWNRGAERDAAAALAELEEEGSLTADGLTLPETRDLERLDAVGEQLVRLRNGGPWWAHLGLYRGDDLLGHLRRAYFARFEEPLALPARNELVQELERLPLQGEEPGAAAPVSYDDAYDALKAYLMMTEYADSADAEFLAATLAPRRLRGLDADSASRDLTRDQYAVYGAELPHGNPYEWVERREAVDGARAYLQTFSGEDQLYRRMIQAASGQESVGAVRFGGGVLPSEREIPGAYTREGWDFIRSSLDENVQALASREEWVTRQIFSPSEIRRMQDAVWDRYVREYRERWMALLQEAEIRGLWPPAVASRTLEALAGNRSPLLRLLAKVSYHTNVGRERVAAAFGPVRAVMPPDTTGEEASDYIVAANEPYMGALRDLFLAVDEASGASRDEWADVLPPVAEAAQRVRGVVLEMQQGFGSEEAALPTEQRLVYLLQRPARVLQDQAETALERGPRLEALAKLEEFCRAASRLATLYPFSSRSQIEASIDELNAALQPESGALWIFADESGLVAPRGSSFRAHPDADPAPSARFVEDFNRWAAVSRALYGGSSPDPSLRFSLRLEATNELPSVTLNVDGRPFTFEAADFATATVGWGPSHGSAELGAEVAGRDEPLLEFQGPWALFQLFQRAEWSGGAGRRWNVGWDVEGVRVEGELTLRTDFPILNPDRWPSLECHPTVER